MNAKVNVTIWLLSMKPNIKEFCKHVKESTSSHHLFSPKYSYFHKIYYVSNNRFIVIFSELLNIYFSVSISKTKYTVNIDKYNPNEKKKVYLSSTNTNDIKELGTKKQRISALNWCLK